MSIHKLVVDNQTTLSGLKKQLRKFLMTGGAYIEVEKDCSEESKQLIFERFLPEAKGSNAAASVILSLIKNMELSQENKSKLQTSQINSVLLKKAFREAELSGEMI